MKRTQPIERMLADMILADPRTYAELSEASGVDGAIWNRLANGKSSVRLNNAESMARTLGYRLCLTPAKNRKDG